MPDRSEGMSRQEFAELANSQMTLTRDAMNEQVGGGHYKDMAIQPAEFIHKNNIGYLQGNVIKYVCRHASKGGPQDIRKAIHYCRLILKLQYGEDG